MQKVNIVLFIVFLLASCASKQEKTVKYQNGDIYSGQVVVVDKKEVKQGKGQYHWSKDGVIYTGNWKNDLMHGKGKISWHNGDFYEGEFKFGKKEGFGRYIWNNGDFYEGDWKDNVRNGKGKTVYINGNVEDGVWLNDKFINKNKQSKQSKVSGGKGKLKK